MPTYRSILKKSFRFTLNHKSLWFVGFWLALFGNGGEYEIFIKNIRRALDGSISLFNAPSLFVQSLMGSNFISRLQNLILFQNPLLNLGLIIVLIGLIYLAITAEGVLIKSVYDSIKLKRKPRIKQTWIKTRSKFFDLLLSVVLFKGGGILLAFCISLPFVLLLQNIANLTFNVSLLIVAFMIFTPLAIIVSFLVKYIIIFIIIKNYTPQTAFTKSITLFKNNWLITLENAFILFVLNLAFGFVTLFTAIIVSFPIIAAIAVIVYPLALPEGHFVTIIAWVSMILLPILGSALSVFQMSAWTVLWTKLVSMRKMHSKLARLTFGVLSKI
jgi:hypothetical protein